MKNNIRIAIAFCLMVTLLLMSAAAMAQEALPSLKEFYADYFDFGSAMSSTEVRDTDRLSFYAEQYAIITPENALKPENVIDQYNSAKAAKENQGNVALYFNSVKPLLNFAQENGLKVNGHVLFWHDQTPDYFFRESYSRTGDYVSRDIMLERMENYVRIVMEYMDANYPGVIVSWDVANEAIDDATGGYRESNYTQIVGEDWVVQAFRFARKYAPEDTILVYNDYSVPYQPKLSGILSLLDELIAEDLIDACGMQCHYQLTTPTAAQLRSAIAKIVAKGLQIKVTEMDILVNDNSQAQFELQASRYQEIMQIFLTYADAILSVQTWGTFDSQSWKSGNYPLLFSGDGAAKPAFYTLVNTDILP